jgi:dolichol-phosphate mannosyltransferase
MQPSTDPQRATVADVIGPDPGSGVWVVLPTYDEAENIRPIASAILTTLPAATLLVVDDASPDGTGRIADELAAADPRIRVRHRAGKAGLGRAYLDGFRVALDGGAAVVVQMDADWSHDPAALPALVGPALSDEADLVIGSRYTEGGGVEDWGLGRRVISRGGSTFARIVLRLSPHDLTGGFKAWRAGTLATIPFIGVHAGGYVFQIEMTFRASRAGARIREIPITFKDRQVGRSKMSRRIVAEALVVVVQLRADELRGRMGRHGPAPEVPTAGHDPGPEVPAAGHGPAPERPAAGLGPSIEPSAASTLLDGETVPTESPAPPERD